MESKGEKSKKIAAVRMAALLSAYPDVALAEWCRILGSKQHAHISAWIYGKRAMPDDITFRLVTLLCIPESMRGDFMCRLRISFNPWKVVQTVAVRLCADLALKTMLGGYNVELKELELGALTQDELIILTRHMSFELRPKPARGKPAPLKVA